MFLKFPCGGVVYKFQIMEEWNCIHLLSDHPPHDALFSFVVDISDVGGKDNQESQPAKRGRGRKQ